MSGPVEYELAEDELALYETYLSESKEIEVHQATLNLVKVMLKKLARDADYITVDGARVFQIIRSRPWRFDANAFKLHDARLYEQFCRQADAEVVSLRLVGK